MPRTDVNDRRDEEIAKAKQLKKDEAEVVDDIDKRILLVDKEDAYDVLQDEFEPKGDLMEHVVASGEFKGQITVKQEWSECVLTSLLIY